MVPLGNDEWTAAFTVGGGPGAAEYTIEAWVDTFASWRKGLVAKVQAGQDVSSELLEGAALLRDAASRSPRADLLLERAALLASDADARVRETAALDPIVADAASAAADRRRATVYDRVLRVLVDRERARFASWYEMFPRSGGTDPTRSATFREAESALPRIAAMAFDVLYLPPVHPIGHTHRKGRNNTLTPAPDDVGSPWAIGESRREATPPSTPASARSRTSTISSRPRVASASRWRSISPTSAPPITPGCVSTRNGSATGPTAPSSTPRTRRRSTRTSTPSTSSVPSGAASGWR